MSRTCAAAEASGKCPARRPRLTRSEAPRAERPAARTASDSTLRAGGAEAGDKGRSSTTARRVVQEWEVQLRHTRKPRCSDSRHWLLAFSPFSDGTLIQQ